MIDEQDKQANVVPNASGPEQPADQKPVRKKPLEELKAARACRDASREIMKNVEELCAKIKTSHEMPAWIGPMVEKDARRKINGHFNSIKQHVNLLAMIVDGRLK